jgi:hypothetical protein
VVRDREREKEREREREREVEGGRGLLRERDRGTKKICVTKEDKGKWNNREREIKRDRNSVHSKRLGW